MGISGRRILGKPSHSALLAPQQHPAALRDSVASPGGTTIAGMHALERGGMRGAVMDAVVAASKRATELRQPPAP